MGNNPSGATHPTIFMLLWAVTSFGLQRIWPLYLVELPYLDQTGKVMAVLGGLLMVWAQIVMARHGATTEHSKPSTTLVTTGPFRVSRNPIYLAMVMIFTGLALAYSNAWGLIMVIAFAGAVRRFTVLPEEAYLDRQFGATYAEYRSSVRRWL